MMKRPPGRQRRCRIQIPIVRRRAVHRASIDLIEMKAITYHEESQGTTFDRARHPARPAEARPRNTRHHLLEAVAEFDEQLLDDYLAREAVHRRDDLRRAHPQGHARRARSSRCCAARRSRTRACSACSTRWWTTCRRPLDMPPVQGHDPYTIEHVDAQAGRRRAVLGAGVQDHDRPVRRQADVLPRLLAARSRPATTVLNADDRHARSASAAWCRCTPTSARRSSEVYCRRHRGGDRPARSVTTGDTLCDTEHPIVLEAHALPRAGDRRGDRAQVEGRTRRRCRRALQRLSEEDPTFRVRTDEETGADHHLGHGRAAPRDHRRPHAARVQRAGQRRQAAGRLHARRSARRPSSATASSARPAARACSRDVTLTRRAAGGRARASSSRTRSWAARSPRNTSRRWRRASKRRWRTASSPAIRWWTSRSRCSTARTTKSTRRKWRSRSRARWRSRKRAAKAKPRLLEPIMDVEVVVPEEYMGDIIGDLSSRRGRIGGMFHAARARVIAASVPLAEMFGYATAHALDLAGARRVLDAVLALRDAAAGGGRGDRGESQELDRDRPGDARRPARGPGCRSSRRRFRSWRSRSSSARSRT